MLVDLPGVQRPRDASTARMARRVREELEGSDAALLILSGEQGAGPGDRFIAQSLAEARLPTTIAVNKADRLNRAQTLAVLEQAASSARRRCVSDLRPHRRRRRGLMAHLAGLLPEGPFLFGSDERSDQPLELLLAELIREAAIRRTFNEVPHAVEVLVEELETAAYGLRADQGADLGREQLTEEHPDRRPGAHDQGDWQCRAARARARAGLPGAPRPVGASRRDWRRDEGLLDRLGNRLESVVCCTV